MSQADGSIAIEVNIDDSNVSKELTKLKTQINKLENAITKQESKKLPLVEQAEQLRQQLKAAQQETEQFRQAWFSGIGGADQQHSQAMATVQRLNTEYQAVVAQIDKIDQGLLANYAALDKNKTAAGELEQQLAAAASQAERAASASQTASSGQTGTQETVDTSAAEQASGRMEGILTRLRSLVSSTTSTVTKGLSTIASGFKALGSRVVSAMGTALRSVTTFIKNGVQKLVSAMGSAVKAMASLFTSSKQTSSSLGSSLKTMLLYTLGLRSLYTLFNKARSAIVEGFQNLAQYSSTTNSSISSLTSALTQLKNSLASAFAPILNVVAPILTRFINMVSAAANAVARLMAMLTGQTSYTKAVAVQEDYADSLGGTADAAEEAAGSLASFDEINTITTENASGSSGGSSGTSADQMFETVEVEPFSFDSWGEAFSAFLDSIIEDGIPRLQSALSTLAGWINSFSANLYEMFTFPGVYDKVVIIGTEVANALNDFVNDIDWATLGGALGAGLNLAFGLLTSFVYTFDWMNLGASLATMLNNAIAEIDFSNLGQLLWAKFKIILETLAGLILELDMTQVAEAFSTTVTSFFSAALETFQTIPWAEIGIQLVTLLNNIDWIGTLATAATAIAAGFNALVTTLATIVFNLDWSGIGTAVGNAISVALTSVDWSTLFTGIVSFGAGLLTGIASAIEAIQWTTISTQIGTALTNAANSVNWTELGTTIGTAFQTMITGIDWVSLLTGLASLITGITSGLSAAIGAVDWGAVGSAVLEGLAAVDWFTMLSDLGTLVGDAITAALDLVFSEDGFMTLVEIGALIVSGLLHGIVNALAAIGTWLKENLVDPIVEGVKSLFGISSPSTVFSEIGTWLIEGLLSGISDIWSSITDFFGESLESLKETLSTAWNSMKETASEVWDNVKESLSEKWESIKETASTTWDNLKETVGDAWDSVKETTSTVWDTIKEGVVTGWEELKSNASEKFDSVKSTISDAWDDLGSNTTSTWDTISSGLSETWESIKSTGTTAFTGLSESGSNIFSDLWETIKSVINSILGGIESMANGVIGGINTVIRALNSLSFTIPDWVPLLGGNTFGFNIGTLSEVSLPRLAEGAVIPPNREFLAVLGDQTSGTNIETPENLLRQIVREESGGGSETLAALLESILTVLKEGQVLMVGETELGRTAAKAINKATRIAGTSILEI